MFGLELFFSLALEFKYDEADAYYYNPSTRAYDTRTMDTPRDNLGLELGFENKDGWSLGWRHDSSPTGGCPINCDEPEYYRNSFFIKKKFGGVK